MNAQGQEATRCRTKPTRNKQQQSEICRASHTIVSRNPPPLNGNGQERMSVINPTSDEAWPWNGKSWLLFVVVSKARRDPPRGRWCNARGRGAKLVVMWLSLQTPSWRSVFCFVLYFQHLIDPTGFCSQVTWSLWLQLTRRTWCNAEE